MPEQDTGELSRALALVANLLAYQIAGNKTVAQGAPLLSRLGMEPEQIARVYDSTAKAVNARIGEAKRKKS